MSMSTTLHTTHDLPPASEKRQEQYVSQVCCILANPKLTTTIHNMPACVRAQTRHASPNDEVGHLWRDADEHHRHTCIRQETVNYNRGRGQNTKEHTPCERVQSKSPHTVSSEPSQVT
jgi:hypothetical protein